MAKAAEDTCSAVAAVVDGFEDDCSRQFMFKKRVDHDGDEVVTLGGTSDGE